ncbi:hypothetical protein HIM_03055 [Hirsutella minnesotensis 3608]|nr:hypothetical protein HIM_03055 [Hirsutella minnesotensis 3608]
MCGHHAFSHHARGYPEALEKLAMLQSNRTTTLLFDKKASPEDLNARALPEMRSWLRRAGYSPQDLAEMRHIHVAGTKGKGSVCAYATAMLKRHGVTVGTYTSPHLVSPRERIAINGEPLGQEAFAEAFFELWDRFTTAARSEGASEAHAEGPESKPFFFRFLTILAWHVFLKQGIRDVVLECGIGGEHDATNVLPPEAVSAAVVTQLGIDHVAMLGDTADQIAWHKAGIMKPGVKCFTGTSKHQPSLVTKVLRDRAAEKSAILVEIADETVQRWGGVLGILKGDFQKRNQALAVMAVRQHLGHPDRNVSTALSDISSDMLLGLKEARLRGRCEVIERSDVTWFIDGAHTTESLAEVARWLVQSLRPRESVILVFNQQERDVAPLLGELVAVTQTDADRTDIFAHAIFTRNDQSRLSKPADVTVQEGAAAMMRKMVPSCITHCFDNIQDAMNQARRLAMDLQNHGKETTDKPKVLVAGSLHLVGAALRELEPDTPL